MQHKIVKKPPAICSKIEDKLDIQLHPFPTSVKLLKLVFSHFE